MKDADTGYIVPPDAVRAVGRFDPDGPLGYRATSNPDAPIRPSRAEAMQDELIYRGLRCPNCHGSHAVRLGPRMDGGPGVCEHPFHA